MSFLATLLIAIGISLVITAFKMIRYLISAKKEYSLEVFNKIEEWYQLAIEGKQHKKISCLEKEIDNLFEKKVLKTSVLNFSDKFIGRYFAHKKYNTEGKSLIDEFNKISRMDLKKSVQSLKILSLTYGYNFTTANYSYLNFWYILRGNYRLYSSDKTDSEGRKYTLEDVEIPFLILKYYFIEK